jgi:hypothetical protein
LRAWKGVETNEIVIENPFGSTSCGLRFKEGSTGMVYASGNPLSTDVCVMESIDEATALRILGEGKVFENPETKQKSFWSTIWREIVSFFN